MASGKDTKKHRADDIDPEALATEGELGTAGAGRKPGTSSTLAGAATEDDEDTREFPSTPVPRPHRGRGTGVKDNPRYGKFPAKPK